MVALSLAGALRSIADFLRYVSAREELGRAGERDASSSPSPGSPFGAWLAAREELGREGDRPHQHGSFLGWIFAPEALGVENHASGGGEASDEEAPHE